MKAYGCLASQPYHEFECAVMMAHATAVLDELHMDDLQFEN